MTAQDDAERAAQHAAKRLARRLKGIGQTARSYSSPGLMLPVLNADPDATSTTNAWTLADGRVRVRLPDGTIKELATTTPGSSTSGVTLPADPQPDSYETTYAATWGRSYCTSHGVETGAILGYGDDDGTHGNRRVMVGIDAATIATDLAGAVIRDVEISLANTDAYDPAGVELALGAHNQTSPPATFQGTRRYVMEDTWPAVGTGDEWRNAPEWYGRAFRDSLAAGITVDQRPGRTYSGTLDWASVRVRITFTR